MHVHVAINGPDRAVRVCDALRMFLPDLLAYSASLDLRRKRRTDCTPQRTQIFTRSFRAAASRTSTAAGTRSRSYVRCSSYTARSQSTRRCGGAFVRISPSPPWRFASVTRSPGTRTRSRSPRLPTRSRHASPARSTRGRPCPLRRRGRSRRTSGVRSASVSRASSSTWAVRSSRDRREPPSKSSSSGCNRSP